MAETPDAPDSETPRWLDDLRPGAEGEGFFEKNLRHSLMFIKRPGDRLLVTFDNLSNVNDDSVMREPWGFKFAQDSALSHLGVMAHVSDWYRDADIIARFQTLARDGFFDGYARVVFAGVSMGGYAALSLSSVVPGAHVIAINPQSTLDPDLVPWETRYENGRRQDWTLPLGDGAALTSGAGRVNVFYDPYHALDQQHVDRLNGDNVHIYKCWFSAHKTAVFLRKIDALKTVMTRAIFDELTMEEFYTLYRNRRNLPWYRGSVSGYFRDKGREEIADRFDKAFRRRLRKRKRKEEEAAAEAATTAPAEQAPEVAAQPTIKRKAAAKAAPTGATDARIVAPANAGRVAPKEQGSDKRLIVTTMKNEGPFMLEWVAYNRAIGFTDFLIYTNDCDDGTDLIAKRLTELGIVEHRQNPMKKNGSPQRAALRDAMKQPIAGEADWLICADCDEFMNIRVGEGRLDDLFAAVGDADAISVCWKLFGNSGRIAYDQDFVISQFDRACGEEEYPNYRALGMKTLVRNSERFERLRIHRPAFHLDRGDVSWVDGGGKPMPDLYLSQGWKAYQGFSHDYVRLHHYAVRSVDSFLVKRDRGRTNHVGDDQGVTYWSNMNYNTEQDTSIHARLPMLREAMNDLLRDPELARLHIAACDWHRAKIEELRKRDGWAEFRDQITVINAASELQEG
ncbi:glycosyltransferase family 2 protein [Roseovarius sp. LXJ103]|uniref:glycosyltransferase family 2 protein n=1 Tax=Roseovarius carneus TaxID=2853164 RepID=UPI000D60D38B|nr:glycosyltransferase family 2 protein [Roseovarius carneus]MBZ8117773.1 glycosyltransferase family 2 protein [Roseovarius carneus]PWE36456.1 glycosyltransferase family 2 protein [Pelagicola sp. LXJ1103]